MSLLVNVSGSWTVRSLFGPQLKIYSAPKPILNDPWGVIKLSTARNSDMEEYRKRDAVGKKKREKSTNFRGEADKETNVLMIHWRAWLKAYGSLHVLQHCHKWAGNISYIHIHAAWLHHTQNKSFTKKQFFRWLSRLRQRLPPRLFPKWCHSVEQILKTHQPLDITQSSWHISLCVFVAVIISAWAVFVAFVKSKHSKPNSWKWKPSGLRQRYLMV